MTEEQIKKAAMKYLTMYGFVNYYQHHIDAAEQQIRYFLTKDETKAIVAVLTEDK